MSAFEAARRDFVRDLMLNFRDGFVSSEAVRAWLRSPEAALLDEESVQARYQDGAHRVDHLGQPLKPRVAAFFDFFHSKAELGTVAVAQREDGNFFLVRDAQSRLKNRLALVHDWGEGLTVFSRWAALGTIFIPKSPSETVYAELIREAQRHSAQRPTGPKPHALNPSGADFIDPALPRLTVGEHERLLEPDLVDRVRSYLVRFFG